MDLIFMILLVLMALWSVFVSIFFMVCAWRAMRAHEHIAQATIQYVRKKT